MSKRILDILISTIGLIFFSPLIFILILIARIDTGESGVFIQGRIGLKGKKFGLLKIRTMKSVDYIQTVVTTKNDPRITATGKLLRNLKFDELPQLWNVLKGEMSLVGPRPEVEDYINLIPKPYKDKILSIRPGITGPATLKYRDEESLLQTKNDPEKYNIEVIFPDKITINLNYIEKYNLFTDLYYIYKTIFRL